MALTISTTRGYTMVAGVAPSVADWNSAFLPSITLNGSIGSSDIADGTITAAKLSANVFSAMPTVTSIATTDLVPFYSASLLGNRNITGANFLNGMFHLAPERTAFVSYTDDWMTWWNGTDAVRTPIATFAEQMILRAPEIASTSIADGVLISQASADPGSRAKLVSLDNFLPVITTAGAYTGVTGVTVDNKGRVTAVTSTGGSAARYTNAALVAIPTTLAASTVAEAHGLATVPTELSFTFECTTNNAGYVVGETVRPESVFWAPGGGSNLTMMAFDAHATATNLYVIRKASTGLYPKIQHKTTGAVSDFTPGSWGIRFSAWK